MSSFWKIFLPISLGAGGLLRTIWLLDMEYKYDEWWMFQLTQKVGVTEAWPHLGMDSSVGLPNPGLSAWIFLVPAKIFAITTPEGLTRLVQLTNVLALLVLALFILRCLPDQEQEIWLWALALACVNPFAVILHRKIWIQSMLPLFCILFWWAMFNRKRPWGAFGCGLLGACLGQIHMVGFALALAVWATYGVREGKIPAWPYWLAGCALGAVFLIPWLQEIISQPQRLWGVFTASDGGLGGRLLRLDFWDNFLANALGLRMDYSLGGENFRRFLSQPIVEMAGRSYPLYLLSVCHYLVVGLLLVGVLKGLWPWGGPPDGKPRFRPDLPPTFSRSAIVAVVVVFGLMCTISGISIHRHYLLVVFPVEFVFLSWLMFRPSAFSRGLLVGMWCLQFVISLSLLVYIHRHGGAPGGDYGPTYRLQLERNIKAEDLKGGAWDFSPATR
ncbi:MAG: hypothetical protein ACUVXF_05740 [Desulfobaccales bacterium]